MLILTRRSGESVAIGDQIRVVILEIRGNQARLGIEAPSHTAVYREEIYEKILAENLRAATTSPKSLKGILDVWKKATKLWPIS